MAGMLIGTVDELQMYLSGVIERADHHAGAVGEIVFAVAGAIVLFKDKGSELRVMARQGETKNVLWVEMGGERFALSYNHEAQTVEIRHKSTQGRSIASISNTTPISEVIALFKGLRDGSAMVAG